MNPQGERGARQLAVVPVEYGANKVPLELLAGVLECDASFHHFNGYRFEPVAQGLFLSNQVLTSHL
jgi:hypothetical protein